MSLWLNAVDGVSVCLWYGRVSCQSMENDVLHNYSVMSSYYGDNSRDVPSWESLENGDDDEAVDQSEVRALVRLTWSRLMATCSTSMLPEITSYSASMHLRLCKLPDRISPPLMVPYGARALCIKRLRRSSVFREAK
jgi:hypothetical protein